MPRHAGQGKGEVKMVDTKQALLSFLKTNENRDLPLPDFYPFFRLWTRALHEEKRWKQKVQVNLDLGLKQGEGLTESVLEHTGIDTPVTLAMMYAIEAAHGTAEGLDPGLLQIAATLHDGAEALGGDVCFTEKTEKDEREERDNFNLLTSVLSKEAAAYFRRAYSIAEERCEACRRRMVPLSSLSRNGRFFWAVEVTGYMMKALYETRRGYKAFLQVFYGHMHDLMALRAEFYSVKHFFPDEVLDEMGRGIRDNPLYK